MEFVLENTDRLNQLVMEAEAKRKPADRDGPQQTKTMYKLKWWQNKTLCKQRNLSSREKKTEQTSEGSQGAERETEKTGEREGENPVLESWYDYCLLLSLFSILFESL